MLLILIIIIIAKNFGYLWSFGIFFVNYTDLFFKPKIIFEGIYYSIGFSWRSGWNLLTNLVLTNSGFFNLQIFWIFSIGRSSCRGWRRGWNTIFGSNNYTIDGNDFIVQLFSVWFFIQFFFVIRGILTAKKEKKK